MKYIQIPDDGVIEKNIMNGEDLIGVCRIDLSYLPVEDVAPVVHGKWIGIDSKPHLAYECSVCKAKWYGRVTLMNYCPKCGAKMDGE